MCYMNVVGWITHKYIIEIKLVGNYYKYVTYNATL